MNRCVKIGACFIAMVLVVSTVLVPTSLAMGQKGEKKASSDDVTRSVINYPANLVNETAKVAVETAKDTGTVIKGTAEAAGETLLAGNVEKAPEIVTTPVKGTVETTQETIVGTVNVPVEAGKATSEQLK